MPSAAAAIAHSSPSRRKFNLWIHDERFSKEQVVVNLDHFPGVQPGDFVRVTTEPIGFEDHTINSTSIIQGHPHSHDQQPFSSSFVGCVVQIPKSEHELIQKNPQLQISIDQSIANFFKLQSRSDVYIYKIDPETIALDFVELSFKDQYVGRSDMWRLKSEVTGTCIYQSKRLLTLGIRAQVRELIIGEHTVTCGIVTENTKIIFRSESAKFFVFIQMSKEMWEFDEDGDLFSEKCIHGFLTELFSRWKEIGSNHVVSIILFSRIQFNQDKNENPLTPSTATSPDKQNVENKKVEHNGSNAALPSLEENNSSAVPNSLGFTVEDAEPQQKVPTYRDFYRVVVDWEIKLDWSQVLIPLKQEFIQFRKDILQQQHHDGSSTLAGQISAASEGNILEAINLALNPLDKHYIDRDLMRTGLSIVVVTPGTGLFEVDKHMLRLTTQRMIENGIGLDLVCLSKPPLHTVPIFQYTSIDPSSVNRALYSGVSDTYGPPTTNAGGVNNMMPLSPSLSGKETVISINQRTSALSGRIGSEGSRNHAALSISPGARAISFEKSSTANPWELVDPLYTDARKPDASSSLKTSYNIPAWVELGFWQRSPSTPKQWIQNSSVSLHSRAIAPFEPRCKMYEIQMMGVMEQVGSSILVEQFDSSTLFYLSQILQNISTTTSPAGSPDFMNEQQLKFDESIRQHGTFRSKSDSNERPEDESTGRLDDYKEKQRESKKHLKPLKTVDYDKYDELLFTMHRRSSSRSRDDGSNIGTLTHGLNENNYGSESSARHPKFFLGSGAGGSQMETSPDHMSYQKGGGDTLRSLDFERIGLRAKGTGTGQSSTTRLSELVRMFATDNNTSFVSSRQESTRGTSIFRSSSKPPPALSSSMRHEATTFLIKPSVKFSLDEEDISERSREDMTNFITEENVSRSPVQYIMASASPRQSSNKATILSSSYRSGANNSNNTTGVDEKSHSRKLSYSGESFKPGSFDRALFTSRVSPGRIVPSSSSQALLGKGMKQHYVNPCNPTKNIIRPSSHMRRWQHIFSAGHNVGNHSFAASGIVSPYVADYAMNWKSLCTPACLPLTTDFFPSQEELTNSYQEYMYTVGPSDEGFPYQDIHGVSSRKLVEGLLKEMVGQRLSQGFQMVSSKTSSSSSTTSAQTMANETGTVTTNTVIKTAAPIKDLKDGSISSASHLSLNQIFFLSLSDQFHELSIDSDGNNVEVRRYVRKANFNADKIIYSCSIWPKGMDFYHERALTFNYSQHKSYNWNYLDHLLSGYQDEMTDATRFWRTRFLLIPAETVTVPNPIMHMGSSYPPPNHEMEALDEEEIRLAGFRRFIELFEKVRWLPSSERRFGSSTTKTKEQTSSHSHINLTTFNASSFVKDELNHQKDGHHHSGAKRRTSISFITHPFDDPHDPNMALTKNVTLTSIAGAMQDPIHGVVFKDRRWHFKLYEKTFIGAEFIDWLIQHFKDIDTREAALHFGNQLFDKEFFEHVHQKHRFLDGHYFYRLKKEYIFQPKEKDETTYKASSGLWFKNPLSKGSSEHNQNSESSMSNSLAKSSTPIRTSSVTGITTSQGKSNSDIDHGVVHEQIELSRRMIIDLDLHKRSNRNEIAFLHYDTIHNPKNCYHFQIHWLVCTARLIEDMLASWSRMADKCGLKLIEAPVEQASLTASDSPFQSMFKISLALLPPSVEVLKAKRDTALNPWALPDTWYEAELLKEFGFVLDVEADDEFPHDNFIYSYERTTFKYTQYVHRSGVAFVQILEKGQGYLWVNNQLLLTSSANNGPLKANLQSQAVSPDFLRAQFEAICKDEEFLTKFWNIYSQKIISTQSIASPATIPLSSTTTAAEANNNVAEKTEFTLSSLAAPTDISVVRHESITNIPATNESSNQITIFNENKPNSNSFSSNSEEEKEN